MARTKRRVYQPSGTPEIGQPPGGEGDRPGSADDPLGAALILGFDPRSHQFVESAPETGD